jgi:flagellar basal body-associated protein FliL
MAKAEAAPPPPEKTESKGLDKAKLIKIAILVAAVLALAGGGWFGWKKIGQPKYAAWKARKAAAAAQAKGDPKTASDPAKAGEEEEEDEAPAKGGENTSGMSLLVLKPIVNLETQRKNAFLKCELHIIFRDPELGKLASGDKPTLENSTIRAMVLEALSGKTVEEASDPETRELVRKDLKDRLNEKYAPKLKPGEKEDPKRKKPRKPVKDILVVDWAIAQ